MLIILVQFMFYWILYLILASYFTILHMWHTNGYDWLKKVQQKMSKKILAVDDDPDIVEVIKIILEEEGYEVSTLTSGINILNIISTTRPDLILLDVMLGGMDGREICKSIKSHSIFKFIPVVMISASHNLKNVLKLPGSPNDFLSKPFDIEQLLMKVKYQLSINS